jgi:hypothetical protein
MVALKIWTVVDAFLRDSRMYTILALILVNLLLAVAEAIKANKFDWVALADFYRARIVPGLIGYFALYLAFGYVAGLDTLLGQGLVTAAFALLGATLVASIMQHLAAIGITAQPTETK